MRIVEVRLWRRLRRDPQIERKKEISKKEGKEERNKFVRKLSAYKGTRRS